MTSGGFFVSGEHTMRIIRTLSDLDSTLAPAVASLVRERLNMIADCGDDELATIYIINDPTDTLDALERVRGRPFADWEYLVRHPGGWFEAVVITCDDGAGDVILMPDRADFDCALLTLCRDNAESGEGSTI